MSNFKCPSCGRTLKVIPLSSGSGGASSSWSLGQTFGLGAGVPEGTAYSKETPTANMSTIEAAVQAPLLQSVITALAGGVLSVVGLFVWDWHWSTPIVIVVATFGISWYLLLTGNRRLLQVVETVDRPEAQQPATFNVEITETLEGQRQRMVFAQFPAPERDVKRFAIAALNGYLTVHGRHRLSRGVFERLRDESLARGLVVWVNPHAHTRGVELTRVGSRVFKRLSD